MNCLIIPSIVIISYLITEFFKVVVKINKKILPVISGMSGAIIGGFAYFFIPETFSNLDILTAISMGIVSGLAATGGNEVFKNIFKKDE